MAMTDFSIVIRSLRARKLSTGVTVLMVAVSVALMLVLFALHSGATDHFRRGTGNTELLVSAEPGPFVSVLNGFFYAGAPAASIDQQTYERFVTGDLSRYFRVAVPIQLGDSYRGYPVVGTTLDTYFRFIEPVAGTPWAIAEGEFARNDFEVVAGSRAARELSLSIGEQISLTHGLADEDGAHVHEEFRFKVTGILKPTGSAHDRALFISIGSSWILHAHDRRLAQLGSDIPVSTRADIIEADKLSTGILLLPRTRTAFAQGGAAIRRTTPLTVASPANEVGQLERALSGINNIFIAMVAVVMVSSALGILLALYNSMDLRRRQIAVLRVLGCSAGRIFQLIITEAAIIGFAGGVAGVGLGLISVRVAVELLRDQLGVVFDPSIQPTHAVGLILAATAIAAVAGILPAVKAYATPVASSLKPLG